MSLLEQLGGVDGGSDELLTTAQAFFDLAERTCGLFSACMDEFPEICGRFKGGRIPNLVWSHPQVQRLAYLGA